MLDYFRTFSFKMGVCSRGGGELVGIPACTEADPPGGGETATAADGTHPTGMHSCLFVVV